MFTAQWLVGRDGGSYMQLLTTCYVQMTVLVEDFGLMGTDRQLDKVQESDWIDYNILKTA